MKSALLIAIVSLAACTETPEASPPDGTGSPMLHRSGTFVGAYEVPIVRAELAAAARFPVAEIDWIVANGVATLHYDLPVGLVGGVLDVTLSGPIDATTKTVTLVGLEGTGECTAEGMTIVCREDFTGLGALPISMAVVEQQARVDFPSGIGQRIEVASVFASDPIGVAIINLATPAVDDHGGGND